MKGNFPSKLFTLTICRSGAGVAASAVDKADWERRSGVVSLGAWFFALGESLVV